ncbi:winged helix-turn-helix transcriptional regulator [Candidatus Woesearchaeota archaeon]|nr:winged helix-turn-helix transcriptional regulator [Candidatus Woesearchaeota archaeon]
MKSYVYYNKKTHKIVDFFPDTFDSNLKNDIIRVWDDDISRRLLIFLSKKQETTVPEIKKKIGHSMSTLHENIKKLEKLNLITSEMKYEGKKHKVILPNVLFITKNPKQKQRFKKFFQGIWVDSKKFTKIIKFLNKHPDKFYTAEEISLKTKIPVDDVYLLLNNWDSPITKALSDFLKEAPFEKKVYYKARKK